MPHFVTMLLLLKIVCKGIDSVVVHNTAVVVC